MKNPIGCKKEFQLEDKSWYKCGVSENYYGFIFCPSCKNNRKRVREQVLNGIIKPVIDAGIKQVINNLKSNICKNCGKTKEEHLINEVGVHCLFDTPILSNFEPQELTNSQSEKSQSGSDTNVLGLVRSAGSNPASDNSLTAEEIQEAIAFYRHLRNHQEVKSSPFPKPMCKICDKFSSEILKKEGTIEVIPLSKHNEEIEKRDIVWGERCFNLEEKYTEFLSRINSIQEKAEEEFHKEQLKCNKRAFSNKTNDWNKSHFEFCKADLLNKIIKTCKEIKGEK